jgi:hypothetical protein
MFEAYPRSIRGIFAAPLIPEAGWREENNDPFSGNKRVEMEKTKPSAGEGGEGENTRTLQPGKRIALWTIAFLSVSELACVAKIRACLSDSQHDDST